MMSPWILSLLSVGLISILSFVGVLALVVKKKTLEGVLLLLVSFAVGALLGDSFFHLIPESYEELGIQPLTSGLILAGIVIFFILEKFVRWHHCHSVGESEHTHRHAVASLNLIGDGVHNFIDGLLIAASYMVSVPVGIATTLAVVLHEIPSEIGDFGVLMHAGMKPRKALWYNFISALMAIAGAIVSLSVGPLVEGYASYLLPITAGGFIYIAGADLIPELHHDESDVYTSLKQLLALVIGLAVMAALLFLE